MLAGRGRRIATSQSAPGSFARRPPDCHSRRRAGDGRAVAKRSTPSLSVTSCRTTTTRSQGASDVCATPRVSWCIGREHSDSSPPLACARRPTRRRERRPYRAATPSHLGIAVFTRPAGKYAVAHFRRVSADKRCSRRLVAVRPLVARQAVIDALGGGRGLLPLVVEIDERSYLGQREGQTRVSP